MSDRRMKGVTIAICTYNGASRIETCLEHVAAQATSRCQDWELLVVDNNSSDGTADAIRRIWPGRLTRRLRIVREPKQGAMHARNRAFREARYSYLSFVDDDNWITPNWIDHVFRIFEQFPQVGIVSCPSTAHLHQPPPDYFEMIQGWLAVGSQCEGEGLQTQRPLSFWTAGCSFRVEALDTLQSTAFDFCLTGPLGKKTLRGEDHELCLTLTILGWEIFFSHRIGFVHDIAPQRLTESYLERLIYNGGMSRAILDVYRNEYVWSRLYHPYASIVGYLLTYFNRMARYFVKSILGKCSKPLDPNRQSYLLAKGRVASYFLHFGTLARAKRNVRIIRRLSAANNGQPFRKRQAA